MSPERPAGPTERGSAPERPAAPHTRVLLYAGLSAAARGAPRLGVYGGSFDPPHRCHAHIARQAALAFRLDHVLFVPAARPPHKPERALAPDHERVALLELLLGARPDVSLWADELLRRGPSYTLDTLARLGLLRGERGELFLILGSDNLAGLPGWRGVEELLARAAPIVATRRGAALDARKLAGLSAAARARVEAGFLPLDPCDASSSELRARLAAGQDPGPDLPAPLREHARAQRLYRQA